MVTRGHNLERDFYVPEIPHADRTAAAWVVHAFVPNDAAADVLAALGLEDLDKGTR